MPIAVLLAVDTNADDAARAYGVAKSWVSERVARSREPGEAASAPRSGPRTSPQRLRDHLVERIAAVRHSLAHRRLDA